MTGIDLTPRELDVMGILWEAGEASVHDVRERLGEGLAYTSVLSALQLLERKGHVGHRREGRAYRYFARVAPQEAGETLLERLLSSVYQSSPVKLVAHLVDTDRLDADDAERIRRLLDEADGGGDPGGKGGKGR